MPLRLVVDSISLADEALRLHRGKHDIIGTGPCARLADIIPYDIQSSSGPPAAVRLSWGLVEFLSLPLLVAGDDILDEPGGLHARGGHYRPRLRRRRSRRVHFPHHLATLPSLPVLM